MEKILRYYDEKSDKFWRIETYESDLLSNWGKYGTVGRYQIQEFDSVEECEKKAEKLIKSKIKKGYFDFADFDKDSHMYFDDPEIGHHILTSHPVFRKYFNNELYIDCCDEEAPFGSDEGSDTYYFLEECLRKNKNLNVLDFPRMLIEDEWELSYIFPDESQSDEDLINQANSKISGLPGEQEILQSDQVILATVFGQLKICGKLDEGLLELAFKSLKRMERLYRLVFNYKDEESPYSIKIMREDLLKYKKENNF